jgi:hypothetical protein
MNTVIFILGSVAAYFPIYWCLSKFLPRRTANEPIGAVDIDEDRRLFMRTLRAEAIARTTVDLRAVLVEIDALDKPGQRAGVTEAVLTRLLAIRLLLQPFVNQSAIAIVDQLCIELREHDIADRRALVQGLLQLGEKLNNISHDVGQAVQTSSTRQRSTMLQLWLRTAWSGLSRRAGGRPPIFSRSGNPLSTKSVTGRARDAATGFVHSGPTW